MSRDEPNAQVNLAKLEREIAAEGFTLGRVRGSHRHYFDANGKRLTFAHHGTGTVSPEHIDNLRHTIRRIKQERREAVAMIEPLNTPPEGTTRKCYICKHTKPLAEFAVNANERGGHAYRCRDCKREEDRARRGVPAAQEKTCATCGIAKPFNQFGPARYTPDHRHKDCKQCVEKRKATLVTPLARGENITLPAQLFSVHETPSPELVIVPAPKPEPVKIEAPADDRISFRDWLDLKCPSTFVADNLLVRLDRDCKTVTIQGTAGIGDKVVDFEVIGYLAELFGGAEKMGKLYH